MRTSILVGNWKSYPVTPSLARSIARASRDALHSIKGVSVVLAPPFPYLGMLAGESGGGLKLAAQDVAIEGAGPFTGAVSAELLRSMNVRYVIVGHSERRYHFGEDLDTVARKFRVAVEQKLIPILCVGERVRDSDGAFLRELKTQLASAFDALPARARGPVIITYEPVWAISSSRAPRIAAPAEVREMTRFIEKTLRDILPIKRASSIPILYGGSVDAGHARALAHEGGISGFLVGGESVRPSHFVRILHALHEK